MAINIDGLGFGENNEHAGRPSLFQDFMQEVGDMVDLFGTVAIVDFNWQSVKSEVTPYRYWQYIRDRNILPQYDGMFIRATYDDLGRKAFTFHGLPF